MAIGLIVASGRGTRMGNNVPKQFMSVNDKPVIIYTLENFQNSDEITDIYLVTLPEWIPFVENYAIDYGISKLKSIVDGGKTVQESIMNGVRYVREQTSADAGDILVLHDGVRPMINQEVLKSVIELADEYDSAVSSVPIKDQIQVFDAGLRTSSDVLDRTKLVKVTTPQAFNLEYIYKQYMKAFDEGIGFESTDYANTMLIKLGETVHLAGGSDKNLKLTTAEDVDIFRALLALD